MTTKTLLVDHTDPVMAKRTSLRQRFDQMSRQELETYAKEVGKLYRKAESVKAELERENDTRLQFLSVLYHEMNTPLTPVLASTGMLKEVLGANPRSTVGRLLSNILAGAET